MRISRVCLKLLNSSFVPRHEPVKDWDVIRLRDFVGDKEKILVLTGAGVSTESGLPDYRSEDVGLYSRNKYRKVPYSPIRYQQFVKEETLRRRFWLQNYLGWPRMSAFQPNPTHLTLKRMELSNRLLSIVTQNVDSLHTKAKSLNVVELHGSAYRVKCLNCDYSIERQLFQEALTFSNPHLKTEASTLAPDGVVELNEEEEIHFTVPDCPDCGSLLKPDIVFFGENIPKTRVNRVNDLIQMCDSLLVLGSSLTVHSSYRIAISVHESKKPVAIVNIGPTRGDPLALLKIQTRCGAILPLAFNAVCELETFVPVVE